MPKGRWRTLLDNPLLIYAHTFATPAAVAIATHEVDLDLPKGFGAKIRKIIWKITHSELITGGQIMSVMCAVINDPDDLVTIEIPVDTVEHDVVDEAMLDLNNIAAQGIHQTPEIIHEFKETEDVLAVRNMRMNIYATALFTCSVKCLLYYNIVPVKDSLLLEMLRIT